MVAKTWDMVADIGGTNMRIARVEAGVITAQAKHAMVPGLDIEETMAIQAEEWGGGAPSRVIAAAAGPVEDGRITITNGGWPVSESGLIARTGARSARVINDFEAAAWSLATLTDDDVQPIGKSGPLTPGHRAAIGPGTGLGVGGLLHVAGRYHAFSGEGGHVGIGPWSDAEAPIFERFAQLWPETTMGAGPRVEAEGMLSGTGLPLLYEACGGAPGTSAQAVFQNARDGDDIARVARQIFADRLAAVAGDLAVTIKASGGVFLVGGVAQANPDVFDARFWEVFCAGGRFSQLRADFGIYLVTQDNFGLMGCINALGLL